MTMLDDKPPAERHDHDSAGHGGHGWMMIVCCIPMLVIAVVLVATGVAGAGFIFVAIMCTAMMWLMMRGMSGSGGH
jgi:Flp pilus assembly protein TadB